MPVIRSTAMNIAAQDDTTNPANYDATARIAPTFMPEKM